MMYKLLSLTIALLLLLSNTSAYAFADGLFGDLSGFLGEESETSEVDKLGLGIGSTIQLGYYEQDNIYSNGREPIEWYVIRLDEGKAMLLSKRILDAGKYNDIEWENAETTTWENCSLRFWLNEEFYQEAFFFKERSVIISMTRATKEHETEPATIEKVSLLRPADVFDNPQMPDISDIHWKTTPTEYALEKGASPEMASYWCCGPGATQGNANIAGWDGGFSFPPDDPYLSHTDVDDPKVGIRPVIWINLSLYADNFR